MDNDRLLEQLNELFDNKLSPIKDELGAIIKRLDLVAAHVAKVDERLNTVEESLTTVTETQDQHSQQLTRIERAIVKHADRLDVLEAKTSHLPTPPHS
jgi:DNA anti-recombination protein RmuC